MKFTQLAPLALAGVLLAGGFASTSLAQQPPRPAMAPGGPDGGRQEGRRANPEAMAARRAERLRDILQLRPEQEPALRAFLDARMPPGGRGERGADRQAMAQMTTPQRLEAQRARMTERLARLDQRIAATKRFYAQLSPAQQKAFDAIQSRGRGMAGHDGKRGMGRGG
jgi:protein CpxP